MLTKIPDFGHFILLDGINSVFWLLINTFLKYFSFLAAGFCPKNLACARKMMDLPDSWGCSPIPQTLVARTPIPTSNAITCTGFPSIFLLPFSSLSFCVLPLFLSPFSSSLGPPLIQLGVLEEQGHRGLRKLEREGTGSCNFLTYSYKLLTAKFLLKLSGTHLEFSYCTCRKISWKPEIPAERLSA